MLLGLCGAATARADAVADPDRGGGLAWRARTTVEIGRMVTTDQLEWIGLDQVGLLADVGGGLSFSPWLEVEGGVLAGAFLSTSASTGAILMPRLGVRGTTTGHDFRIYGQVDVGIVFTGPFNRPGLRLRTGVELPVGTSLLIGPTLSYGHVFQHDGAQYSSDAGFFAVGLSASLGAGEGRPLPPPARLPRTPPRVQRAALRSPPPAEPYEPPPPSADLDALLDRAVPASVQRIELLATVLFAFDSDALEPVGVAMLHEVARHLGAHPEIELVEIVGYADGRGSEDYNRALSARRAARVLEWLVAHGIEASRLQLAGRGASEQVEVGTSDADHLQNRRVVFRVIRTASP